MKSLLLIVSIGFVSFSFGQKKLLSRTFHQFNYDSSIVVEDSISFIYFDWQGSINDLKPKLELGQHTLSWEYPSFEIPCHEQKTYSLNPLLLLQTKTKINYNNLVVETNGGGYKIRYTYDSVGNKTQKVTQNNFNGPWETMDSTVWFYDSLNNMIYSEQSFIVSGITYFGGAYSYTYFPGTTLVQKILSLSQPSPGSLLVPNERFVVSYNGSEIDNIETYTFAPPSYDVVWNSHNVYTYTSGNISDIKMYAISNNAPVSAPSRELIYSYDSQNQIIESDILLNGSIDIREQYEYDSPNFISKYKRLELDSSGQLYEFVRHDFTYQNTLDIKTIETNQVEIYPNPTKEYIWIKSESPILQIALYDINGRLLLEQDTNQIDLRDLPIGSYFLKGQTTQGVFNEKIVKL